MITNTHQASLKARTISTEAAIAAGIRSAQTSEIAATLGLTHVPAAGMLIPYFEASGEPVIGDDGLDLVRVRYDGDASPKYASRGGSGFSVYLTRLIRSQIAQADREYIPMLQAEYIVITEGEFKAMAVEGALNIPAIGLPGVTMFRDPGRDKSIPPNDLTPLHPHLAAVLARARGVVVVADSDAANNSQVRGAMTALKRAISTQFKIPAAYCEVPGSKRGRGRPKQDDGEVKVKEEKLGIDDWLNKVGAGNFDSVAAFLNKSFNAEVDRLAALESGGYIALGQTSDEGTSGGSYCVFSIEKQSTVHVKPTELTNLNTLIHICGLEYLLAKYPKISKDGHLSVDSTRAGGELAKRCNAAGWWNDDRKRGTGVWPLDDQAVMVNSASGIWATDGRSVHRVGTGKGAEVYVSARDLEITPQSDVATAEEAQQVLDAAMTWNWSNPAEARLAIGWVAAAYYCGALDHRPMLYVTGERGSGKSEFLKFARNLLGTFALNKLEGTTLTEPALRRKLGRMSLATVLDEAEATDYPERLTAIIAYLRASYDGETGTKGSASHGGIDEFTMRTMTALAAVSPLRLSDAEQSRFLRLHIEPRVEGAAVHELVSTPTSAWSMGERIAARMLHSWPRFRAALAFSKPLLVIAKGTPPTAIERYRNTVGTAVAAGWVLLNDCEPTERALKAYVDTVDVSAQRERIVETRSDINPLEWLLDKVVQSEVQGRSTRVTIRELVINASDDVGSRSSPFNTALGRLGLRVGYSESGFMALLMNPSNSELLNLFATQSRWPAQDIEQAFRTQVTGCGRKRESKTTTIGGKALKPLAIAVDSFISRVQEYEAKLPLNASAQEYANVYGHAN